jgi:hypothetical protein
MINESFKACPFCKEQIRAKAVKCRFCGEWLEKPAASIVAPPHTEVTPLIPPAPAPERSDPPVDNIPTANKSPSIEHPAPINETVALKTETDSNTGRPSLPESTIGSGTDSRPKPIEFSQTFLDEQRSNRLGVASLIYGAILLVYLISAANRCWGTLGADNTQDGSLPNIFSFIINTLVLFIAHAFMSVMGILFLATYVIFYKKNRKLKPATPEPVSTGDNGRVQTVAARPEPIPGHEPPLTPVQASYKDFMLAEKVFRDLQHSLNRNPTREQWEPEFLARKNPAASLPRLVLEELWIAADPAAWKITAQRPAPVSGQHLGLQWLNGIFIVITGWGCILPLFDGNTAPDGFQKVLLVAVIGLGVMFSNLSAILAARQPANHGRRNFAKWANTAVMGMLALLFFRYAITSASFSSYLAAAFMALPAVINLLTFGKPLKKSTVSPVPEGKSIDSTKISPAKFNLAGASFLLAGVLIFSWMFRDVHCGRANLQALAESLTVMIIKSLIAAGLLAWIIGILAKKRTGQVFLVFAVAWAGLTAYDAVQIRSAFDQARAARSRPVSEAPTAAATSTPAAVSAPANATPAVETAVPNTTGTADNTAQSDSIISDCTNRIMAASSDEVNAITQLQEANIYDLSLLTNRDQMMAEMQKRVAAEGIYQAFETNMDNITKDTQLRLDRLGTPQANKSADQLVFEKMMVDLVPV